jgi:hypothetical protein
VHKLCAGYSAAIKRDNGQQRAQRCFSSKKTLADESEGGSFGVTIT